MTSSTAQSAPATFLNLDLELRSCTDLSPLATYLQAHCFVLYNGEVPGGFLLCLEPLIDGALNQDAQRCTSYFLEVLEQLPPHLKTIWHKCSSRLFDYGFDGGREHPPLGVTLPCDTLKHITQWGIDIQMTIYPYREHETENDPVPSIPTGTDAG